MAKKKKPTNYLYVSLFSLLTILIVHWLWPSLIPLGILSVWRHPFSIETWFKISLPLLTWACCLTTVLFTRALLRPRSSWNSLFSYPSTPSAVLRDGFIRSLFAGITEEIAFRWLIFLSTMVWIQVTNFLFFGFLGFGVGEWLHLHLFGPLADWVSLGYLHPYLFHQSGWVVGASLLVANGLFRGGHLYQGWFGWINSWFIGMYCFWVTLNHGLLMAMLLHFSNNMIFFTADALLVAIRRHQRRRRSNQEIWP